MKLRSAIMTVRLLLTLFIILGSVYNLEATYVNRNVVTKFLKQLQANGPVVQHDQVFEQPAASQHQHWTSEFADKVKNSNFDELQDSDLPFQTPFNEWVLNQVKDPESLPIERLPGGLAETPLGDISLTCYNDTVRFAEDEKNGVDYAIALRASFANYQYLFERYEYTGQWRFLGDFDLCGEVRIASKYSPIDSRYCLQNMAGLQVGTCWPASCSDEDLYTIVFTYLGFFYGILMNPYVMCEDKVDWFAGSIATISVIALFGFIVAAATTYHLTAHHLVKRKLKKAKDIKQTIPTEIKHNGATYGQHVDDQISGSIETKIDGDTTKITTGQPHDYGTVPLRENNVIYEPSEAVKGDFIAQKGGETHSDMDNRIESNDKSIDRLAFVDRLILTSSAIHNADKFFDCTVRSPTTLCLNGLRTLSMFWIILGHTAMFAGERLANGWRATEQAGKVTSRAVSESPFGVDTFFFLSGLLVAYLTLKQLAKNNGSINWGLFYFHRFWRITPMYMITLAVWANLFLQWGQGPAHNMNAGYIHEVCGDLWWTHLLYINNLYPFPGDVNVGTCMGWTWYLANDMQFFIISPILLIILYKSWKWGVGTIVGMCLISLGSTMYLTMYWGLGFGSTGLYNNRTLEDTRGGGDYIYAKPYVRIPSYLIGFLFGYMLYRLKGRQISMKPWQCILGWLVAVFTGLAIVYAPFWFSEPGTPQWVSVLYNTFTRPAFTLAVAWVAFACIMGYGGLVNKFLSWTVWIPLGRLTFGAYLVHPMVILWYIITTKVMLYFSYTSVSYLYVSSVVFSYATAFVFALIIEGPTAGLEEVLIGKWRRGTAPAQRAKAT